MSKLDQLKQEIVRESQTNPDKFFPTTVLKELGFDRQQCANCGKYFWSMQTRDHCGEPECSSGYSFIGQSPADETFTFAQAWQAYSQFMEERGYTPIKRYPVVARWRDDTDFVQASIYDFQPWVVSGEVEPPANPLVVPQFCLRFNDIDNVGLTGRHNKGFVMVGQHAFTSPEDYQQDKYFRDMLDWVVEGMGIAQEEVILHEDGWAGGGNLGACMEFFVEGLELFNQVYMFYGLNQDGEGYSELNTRVLDMGLGLERIVWITNPTETAYEANMPHVVHKLVEETATNFDKRAWRQFLPYSGLLDLESEDKVDREKLWQRIAENTSLSVPQLKKKILPMADIYTLADHSRSLLVALNDGILPSNTGGGYNLRVLARKCFEIIDRRDWDLDLSEIVEWHLTTMEPIFPELSDNLEDVKQILRHEKTKYNRARNQAKRLAASMKEREETITEEELYQLYDSQGISPEFLQEQGLEIEVPQDFYQKVTARQESSRPEKEEEASEGLKIDREGLSKMEETDLIYRQDEKQLEFEANVVYASNGWIALDRTAFYPTSGGQEHDEGFIDRIEVKDVRKVKGIVLHKLGQDLEVGKEVKGDVDSDRRLQLMQHHTAAHILNGAAREVLGEHVWQAGASKKKEKARLDITHYKNIGDSQREQIEARANEIVRQDLPVHKRLMRRDKAEKEYGFRLYQGGAVPESSIRVVEIPGIDVEACGGTHCDRTSEVDHIAITSTSKIQDGVIRLNFRSGPAAEKYLKKREEIKDKITAKLGTKPEKGLKEIAEVYSTTIEELPSVIDRFIKEWKQQHQEIKRLSQLLEGSEDVISSQKRPNNPKKLFESWKQQQKTIKDLKNDLVQLKVDNLSQEEGHIVRQELQWGNDLSLLISIAQQFVDRNPARAVILRDKEIMVGAAGEEIDFDVRQEVAKHAKKVVGDTNFVKGFKLTD